MMAIEKDMDQRAGPSIPRCDDFLHDFKDSNNGYEEEYNCRTHIFYDFHCQVLFIRTMNIQT